MKTEDHIANFILYSMLVYPITNYLVSGARSYSKTRGVLYAVVFLALVAFLQFSHDLTDREANFYGQLGVVRTSSLTEIRRSFKRMSLDYHPDKNKDPNAVDVFRRIKSAYEILTNQEARRVYDRFGMEGLKALSHGPVDGKFTVFHLVLKYSSSLFFTFFMNMSDVSGPSIQFSLFVLCAILYCDILVLIGVAEVPSWLFPSCAPFELVSFLNKLYPTFLNGSRCIINSFASDSKSVTIAAVSAVQSKMSDVGSKLIVLTKICRTRGPLFTSKGSSGPDPASPDEGSLCVLLDRMKTRVQYSSSASKAVEDIDSEVARFESNLAFVPPSFLDKYSWMIYTLMYLAAFAIYKRFVVVVPVDGHY